MPFQLGANAACPVANTGRFGPQFGIVDHFFDVAQTVGPVEEVVAGNRGCDPFTRVFGRRVARRGRAIQPPPANRVASRIAPARILRIVCLPSAAALIARLTLSVLAAPGLLATRLVLAFLLFPRLPTFLFFRTRLSLAGLLSAALLSARLLSLRLLTVLLLAIPLLTVLPLPVALLTGLLSST